MDLKELQQKIKEKENRLKIRFETYEEFKERNKKYNCVKCFVRNCNEIAYYEGGDSRYLCPMCEKHSNIEKDYIREMCSLLGL